MGETKLQRLCFTVMMCFFMVLGMTVYNMLLNEGWSRLFFARLLRDFWPGFAVALVLDVFVVSKIAKPLALRLVDPGKGAPKVLVIVTISSFMVVGMVACMSVYGAVVAFGWTTEALRTYPLVALRNFVMALPLNLLVVSPLVRAIFGVAFRKK